MNLIVFTLLILISCSPRLAFSQATPTQTYTIHFPTASAEVNPALIEHLLAALKTSNDYYIALQGHSDNVGQADDNLKLSRARAKAVRKQLLAAGIAPKRIKLSPYGESRPVASNRTKKGRKRNRRVEVVLTTLKDWEAPQRTLTDMLNRLAEARKQDFEVIAGQAATIVGRDSTYIRIPADAFDAPAGTKIQLKLTEAYEVSDMLINQWTTTSDDQILIGGGMIKLEAQANGQAVQLKANKSLTIQIPADDSKAGMMLYDLEQLADRPNWINPRPISNYRASSTDEPIVMDELIEIDAPFERSFSPIPAKLPKPKAPALNKKDMAKVLDYQHKINQLKANPWKGFKPYRQKRFLFIKYKVKKNKADSLAYQKQVATRLKRLQKELEVAQVELDQKKAILDKNYQQQLKLYQTNQTQRDSLRQLNRALLLERKDAKALRPESFLFSEKERTDLAIKLYHNNSPEVAISMLTMPENRHDSIVLANYCNFADTAAMRLVLLPENRAAMAACIFPEDSKWRQKLPNLDFIADHNTDKPNKQRIDAEVRQLTFVYEFALESLSQTFNGRKAPPAWFQEHEQKDAILAPDKPALFTRTYLIFEGYRTLLLANKMVETGGVPNDYLYFPSLPMGLPVVLVSLTVDEEENIYLAITQTTSQERFPSLQYKPVDNPGVMWKMLKKIYR